jgi:hypothetical protein
MTSRNLPTRDISIGSVTLLAPEAGDIVELILLSSRFNIKKFYVLTTENIYTSCIVLRTNSYISLNSNNWLFFNNGDGVYCAVRSESLNRTRVDTGLSRANLTVDVKVNEGKKDRRFTKE